MNTAQDFVERMLPRFGVGGANNTSAIGALTPKPCHQLRAARVLDGVTYGYDGQSSNLRNSPASVFWVEYLENRGARREFQLEIDSFLLRVANEFGKISVSGTGSALSCLLLRRAKALDLDVQQNVIRVSGYSHPGLDQTVQTKIKEVSPEEIERFAIRFVEDVHCNDPWYAFDAMHAIDSNRFHLFTSAEWRLINYGYDGHDQRFVGPPTWALLDLEKFTAIDRWCQIHDLPGTDSVLRATPGIVASQFGSSQFSEWLRDASMHAAVLERDSSFELPWLVELLRAQDHAIPAVASARYAYSHEDAFRKSMREIRKKTRQFSRVREVTHATPLWRLFETLRLDLPEGLDSRLIYGTT